MSPDDKQKREIMDYVSRLASEEEIEEFMDEVNEELDPTFYKRLEDIANRKLRRLRGATTKASEMTSSEQSDRKKKFSAMKTTLFNGAEKAENGKLPPNYYAAVVKDIDAIFSFKKLAEYRELVWGMKQFATGTKWNITDRIQARFNELNNEKYSETYKERQKGGAGLTIINYNGLKEMVQSIEPNRKGTLDKELYLTIQNSIKFLPEKEKEEMFKLIAKIPEINPAVVERLRGDATFQMAEPNPKKQSSRNMTVPDNVVDFVNRVAGTQIRKGIKFEDTLDLTDIRGYSGKINFGASFIDFVDSLKRGRKANKADKVMLGDVLGYFEAVKNKKFLDADVAERIRTCA
jgi:hypothetical protein